MAADPWVKVWWNWYTTRSHLTLSFDALHLGPYFMTLAKASPEQPWLLDLKGRPLSFTAIAQGARMQGPSVERLSQALRDLAKLPGTTSVDVVRLRALEALASDDAATRVKGALDELVDAETMVRRDDDVTYGFTKDGWASYQRSSAYFRVQEHRKKQRAKQEGNAPLTDRDQRSEIRSSSDEEEDARAGAVAPELRVFIEQAIERFERATAETTPRNARPLDGRLLEHMAARIGVDPKRRDLAWWDALGARFRASSFLTRRKKPKPATLLWLIEREDRLKKTIDGEYDDHAKEAEAPPPPKPTPKVRPAGHAATCACATCKAVRVAAHAGGSAT